MKVNILGAGITGLTAAYLLTKKGYEVCVYEKEADIGGLAGGISVNGTFLEKYYHHSFAGHHALRSLMKELNIDNKYFFRNVKTGFYYQNHIYPFVGPKDLLFFKPLPLRSRFRLGMTSLMMMKIKDWRKLEKSTALEWLRKYSGEEACRVIWEPLLSMKFGDDYNNISAAWLWNRVVDRKKAGRAKDVLGYIQGGYKTLLNALKNAIEKNGGKVFTNSPAEIIKVENDTCTGVSINGKEFKGDMLLSTVPIPIFVRMAPFLSKNYVDALSTIRYQGSVCVILKLKKALSHYYWINVSDPQSPFVGIIEHTNFVSPEEYGNNHIVYLTKYVSSENRIFLQRDEDIFFGFASYLERLFSDFDRNNIVEFWVIKDRYSQPVFVKNYSKILPASETPVKNIFMLNTAQIYPQSRSLNSAIEMAEIVVGEMAHEIQ